MTEQLTGYEASSVAEIEAILDALPADADTVYLDTIAYSERAIAAVAAKRAGGGGSIPVPSTQDFIGGSITTVANGANANMPWDTGSVIGDDLVDLSDPARPAVRTAGIYAVTVNLAAVTDMTVNGFFDFEIQLDANGADLSGPQDSRLATAAHPQPQSVQTVVGYIPAGGLIIVTMHNRDGAAAVDFALESAFIQRIT